MNFTGNNSRIVLYSPGMVGLGHIRRNVAIAEALSRSSLNPIILLIAENREAAAFQIPKGVDCVTLPAYRKDLDGQQSPRYLNIDLDHLIRIRSRIVASVIEEFAPHILIVDHLARGAFDELDGVLYRLKRKHNTKCILGLRDILGDPEDVRKTWKDARTIETIRKFYDFICVYGDPKICNLITEYGLSSELQPKIRYMGYLNRRASLPQAIEQNHDPFPALNLPEGRLALCLLGGGQDGKRLAESFAMCRLPDNMNGIIITGPFMSQDGRRRLYEIAANRPRLRVLQFIGEPILLLNRADLVVSMGGYNSVSEILSFEKRSLIVPRAKRAPEQSIRAERLHRFGLIDFLPSENLSPEAITSWLNGAEASAIRVREQINMNGLECVSSLLKKLLQAISEESREAGILRIEPAFP